ncbi:terminase small subunit-like protein [Sphingomonas oryzagri]
MATKSKQTLIENPVPTPKLDADSVADVLPKPSARSAAQAKLATGAKDIQAKTQQQTQRKRGQPTMFTPELWEEVMERVSCGHNLLDICDEKDKPAYSTVNRWMREKPELRADMEQAWIDSTYLSHFVNDSVLRGGVMSTGDFRRDEAIVTNNRWFMGKVHRRIFGDKQTVDLNQTVSVTIPAWATALPAPSEDGEVIDADAIYEAETVKRLTQQDDTPKPD